MQAHAPAMLVRRLRMTHLQSLQVSPWMPRKILNIPMIAFRRKKKLNRRNIRTSDAFKWISFNTISLTPQMYAHLAPIVVACTVSGKSRP